MSWEDYQGDGFSPIRMDVIESEPLQHPIGFIVLKERPERPRVRVPCGSRRVAPRQPNARLWAAMAQQQQPLEGVTE